MTQSFLLSATRGLAKYGYLKYAMIIRLVFGLYCKLGNSKVVNFTATAYCYSLLIPSFYVCAFGPNAVFHYQVASVEYFLNVCISHWLDKFFARYCTIISAIDSSIGLKIPINSIFAQLQVITVLILRVPGLLFTYLDGSFDIMNSTKFGILYPSTIGIMTCANSTLQSISVVGFDLLRVRIQFLSDEVRQLLVTEMSLQDQQRKIKKVLVTYKNLLDNLQNNINPTPILVNIMFRFVCLFNPMYLFIQSKINDVLNGSLFVLLAQVIIMNTMPLLTLTVVAELVLYEYSQLNALTGELLLHCKGECRELVLELLEYLEVRPPRVVIWRVVPVDLSLLLSFASLLTSYVIVLLQFS